MTLDEITDILLDGTDRQIMSVSGSGAWFRYSPASGTMTIGLAGVERRMHKVGGEPNCARLLGNSFSFGGSS